MPNKTMQADKRIRILEALNLCLQEKPFDKTSIKDIAGAAGVNHGLLHYYFASKEDMLVNYIDYVISHYRSRFEAWLSAQQRKGVDDMTLVESFFAFMNDRITLNTQLSKVFIEIWEIGAYNPQVRQKLQAAYTEWMEVLGGILARATGDQAAARRMGTAIVAFLEGMSLFSIILDPEAFDFQEVLTGFQRRIIEML